MSDSNSKMKVLSSSSGLLPKRGPESETPGLASSTSRQNHVLLKNDSLSGINMEGEKLKKRILRSKVIKIIDRSMSFECEGLKKHAFRTKEFEDKLKKIKDSEFREMIESTDFKKKPLVFSLPQSNEYVPSLKKKALPKAFPMTTKKLKHVSEICKNLTKNEILEIGEDPGYFIVLKEHKRIPELLNSDKWNLESGFSLSSQEEIQKKNRTISSKDENFFKHTQLFEKYQAPKQDPDELEKEVCEKVEECLKRKEKVVSEREQYFKNKNSQREMAFHKNLSLEQGNFRSHLIDLEQDLRRKVEKANGRVEELRRAIIESKIKAAEREEEERGKINNFWKEKREKDKISQLSEEIKQICVDRKIKENMARGLEERRAKTDNLRKIQEKIKEKKQLELHLKESIL